MWGIFKKHLLWFASYTIPFSVFLAIYNITASMSRDLSDFRLIFSGFWIAYLTLGAITMTEQYEFKNNGYKFLDTLPLTAREIVRGKFLLALVNLAFCVGIFIIQVLLISTDVDYRMKGVTYILALAAFTLIASGLVYSGVFRWGIGTMLKWVWIGLITFLVTPIMLDIISGGKILLMLDAFAAILALPWYVWLLCLAGALAAYNFLMNAAVRTMLRYRF